MGKEEKKWHVVYRDNSSSHSLRMLLEEKQIENFIPTIHIEEYEDGEIRVKEKDAISGLAFVRTDDVYELTDKTKGLICPYKDSATGKPAIVRDEEMERFINLCRTNPMEIRVLDNPIETFRNQTRVRVKEGPFKGWEGYLVRIRRDRKFVVSLGDRAISISNIHFSLLEKIDN